MLGLRKEDHGIFCRVKTKRNQEEGVDGVDRKKKTNVLRIKKEKAFSDRLSRKKRKGKFRKLKSWLRMARIRCVQPPCPSLLGGGTALPASPAKEE